LAALVQQGLPDQLLPALHFLLDGRCATEVEAVAASAEGRRREIAAHGEKRVPIFYSPKPKSAGTLDAAVARPEPGKVLEFTMERIAATGKDRRWGIALHLIARHFESRVVFELGACAGISARYLAAAPSVSLLLTAEGSSNLADIAVESLRRYPAARVVNGLFDEVMDQELPKLSKKIDFAYIDGHHEKVATVHYFNRLLPYLEQGAVVIFDDISWSADMREAWNVLRVRPVFAHAVDLGAIGVCVLSRGADAGPGGKQWDLQPITGRHAIATPHGWSK
jgi:predicted O-methyltransferase YrrM